MNSFSQFMFSCSTKLKKGKFAKLNFSPKAKNKEEMDQLYNILFSNPNDFIEEIQFLVDTNSNAVTDQRIAHLIVDTNPAKKLGMELVEDIVDKYTIDDVLEEAVKYTTNYTTEEVYNFLIEQGANPNGKFGMIFAQACKYGNMIAVKLFVEKYKVDTNTRDGMPIMLALRKQKLDIAKYLIEHGANIHIKQDMPVKMMREIIKSNKEGDVEWLKTYLHS